MTIKIIGWVIIPASIVLFTLPSQKPKLISTLEETMPQGNNILYSPALRAAWTDLQENVIGEEIILQKPLLLADMLSKNPYHFYENDHGLYVKSGFVNDGVIEKIKEDLKQSYGISDASLDVYYNAEDGIISYAYFDQSIGFDFKFQPISHDFQSVAGIQLVECFGVKPTPHSSINPELMKQVKLYDFISDEDFILSLTGKQPELEIILARMDLEKNLNQTINMVMMRMSKGKCQRLSSIDELVIPKIKIAETCEYEELNGRFLANKGFEQYFFIAALQSINFTMDESGAKAEGSAEIVMEQKGAQPKQLVFDKPFLLLLKNKNTSEPILALYIRDTEFLIPVE